MNAPKVETTHKIQRLIVRLLATNPAGNNLCMIGGFRYQFLNESARRSQDVDYHWEGDLDRKQKELISLFRRKLLPEVMKSYGYDGTVFPATGPDADSPFVKIVETTFYQPHVAGSRIEIPVEITRIACLDGPIVRTVDGVVYLSVSDADMIESKVVSLFNRLWIEGRDFVDIFLFQNQFAPDAARRIQTKFAKIGISAAHVANCLRKIIENREGHIRDIKAIIDDQVEPHVAANIAAGGGAARVFDSVIEILRTRLSLSAEG
jgi:hypothetical protein